MSSSFTVRSWLDAVLIIFFSMNGACDNALLQIHGGMMRPVRTGLEEFIKAPPNFLKNHRIGLLCNPASVDPFFIHIVVRLRELFPGNPVLIFSPQHGFFAEKQDNMIESEDTSDPIFGIPVLSLYGRSRMPRSDIMDQLDTLVVDLQDVGCRVYTFIYTLSYCMEKAAELGKKVVVLDRPNPLGGEVVEGNLLSPEFASFVGRYPIPMRHGLTIGEIARLFNDHFEIGCDLMVIPMSGWRRSMLFAQTGLPWVQPSPNLPIPESAAVYPGQVIWEGTNLSEGRGTTRPFEIFGAPFVDCRAVTTCLGTDRFPGAVLRPLAFEPTWNKWQGHLCKGFQLHVTDLSSFRPLTVALKLLQAVMQSHPDTFQWKAPPYEYEFERLPIDLILGDASIRQYFEGGGNAQDLISSWEAALTEFRQTCSRFYLYPE